MIGEASGTPGPGAPELPEVQQFIDTSTKRGLTEALVELNQHKPPLPPSHREVVIHQSLETLGDEAERIRASYPNRRIARRGIFRDIARRRALARNGFSHLS